MNEGQKRCQLRKAQIISNIQGMTSSNSVEAPTEEISHKEFQERIKKGEKFFTKQNIEQFNGSVKKSITAAYSQDEKQELRNKADKELNLLKAVNVVTETGMKIEFFTKVEKSEE